MVVLSSTAQAPLAFRNWVPCEVIHTDNMTLPFVPVGTSEPLMVGAAVRVC